MAKWRKQWITVSAYAFFTRKITQIIVLKAYIYPLFSKKSRINCINSANNDFLLYIRGLIKPLNKFRHWTMSNYAFEYEMEVRDYELDFQGVVNNSNYQHYLEHARHQFLKTRGGSMSALHDAGVDPDRKSTRLNSSHA